MSRRQSILDYINASEYEQTPKIIAEKTGIRRSSVRVYVRQLLKDGKILQPYPGAYASRITYGMMLAPLRCHNIVFTVDAPWLGFSEPHVVEFVGDVRVEVQFGLQRRKITGRISCGRGMDRDTCFFALNRVLDVVEGRTGRRVEGLLLRTFELNRDVAGVRLDGAQCFTRTGLFGFLERVYQKSPDVVRSEVKVSREMSPTEFEALLHGGVPIVDVVQAQFVLAQRIGRLEESLKYNSELLGSVLELLRALLKNMKQ